MLHRGVKYCYDTSAPLLFQASAMLAQVMGAGVVCDISLGAVLANWRSTEGCSTGGTTLALMSTHFAGSMRGSTGLTSRCVGFGANAGFAGT